MRNSIAFMAVIALLATGCSKSFDSKIVGKWTQQSSSIAGNEMECLRDGQSYQFTTAGECYITDHDGIDQKGIYAINDTTLFVGYNGSGISYTIKSMKSRTMTLQHATPEGPCTSTWKK